MGFARSRAGARQLVNHGHILVNGKKCDIASRLCEVGDVIESHVEGCEQEGCGLFRRDGSADAVEPQDAGALAEHPVDGRLFAVGDGCGEGGFAGGEIDGGSHHGDQGLPHLVEQPAALGRGAFDFVGNGFEDAGLGLGLQVTEAVVQFQGGQTVALVQHQRLEALQKRLGKDVGVLFGDIVFEEREPEFIDGALKGLPVGFEGGLEAGGGNPEALETFEAIDECLPVGGGDKVIILREARARGDEGVEDVLEGIGESLGVGARAEGGGGIVEESVDADGIGCGTADALCRGDGLGVITGLDGGVDVLRGELFPAGEGGGIDTGVEIGALGEVDHGIDRALPGDAITVDDLARFLVLAARKGIGHLRLQIADAFRRPCRLGGQHDLFNHFRLGDFFGRERRGRGRGLRFLRLVIPDQGPRGLQRGSGSAGDEVGEVREFGLVLAQESADLRTGGRLRCVLGQGLHRKVAGFLELVLLHERGNARADELGLEFGDGLGLGFGGGAARQRQGQRRQ